MAWQVAPLERKEKKSPWTIFYAIVTLTLLFGPIEIEKLHFCAYLLAGSVCKLFRKNPQFHFIIREWPNRPPLLILRCILFGTIRHYKDLLGSNRYILSKEGLNLFNVYRSTPCSRHGASLIIQNLIWL